MANSPEAVPVVVGQARDADRLDELRRLNSLKSSTPLLVLDSLPPNLVKGMKESKYPVVVNKKPKKLKRRELKPTLASRIFKEYFKQTTNGQGAAKLSMPENHRKEDLAMSNDGPPYVFHGVRVDIKDTNSGCSVPFENAIRTDSYEDWREMVLLTVTQACAYISAYEGSSIPGSTRILHFVGHHVQFEDWSNVERMVAKVMRIVDLHHRPIPST